MTKFCKIMRKCMKFNKIFLAKLALYLSSIKDNWLNMKELTLKRDLFNVMFVQKILSPNHISKGTRKYTLMNSSISPQFVLRASDKLSIYRIIHAHTNLFFLFNLYTIFYFFQISYTIFVIEQLPGKPFNRAKLFNIGFQEAKVSQKESTTL